MSRRFVNVRAPDGPPLYGNIISDQDEAAPLRKMSMLVHKRLCMDKVEGYFARQMGMTVPEWREAQAKRQKP